MLNLSIKLIDALQLEFGLVENSQVFLEVIKLYWSNNEGQGNNRDYPTHIGNCLVFTLGENIEQKIMKVLKV